jgi:Flp pilus assembly secretin CpaC
MNNIRLARLIPDVLQDVAFALRSPICSQLGGLFVPSTAHAMSILSSCRRVRRRHGVMSNLLAGALALAALVVAGNARANDMLTVSLDQATVVRMPERVTTLIIGNPLIADVSLQAGGIMVVTGKGFGVTNVLALDRSGAVLMDKAVQVRGPRDDVLVLHRGVQQESYSCAPNCERRITLGDAPGHFEAALNQTMVRNGSAQGTGAAK